MKEGRKELESERKIKINLEKKLSNFSVSLPSVSTSDSPKTLCTICSLPIIDYTPKYFLGHEINPSCKLCYEKSSDENSDTEHNDKKSVDSEAIQGSRELGLDRYIS